jgi:hypothetical protein
MTSATRLLLAALAMTTLAPRSSFAQTTAADVSLARQLGNDGLALAGSGDCAAAVEKLTRAEGLYHAPTTLTVLGECHIALGKLVDGVEELTRVAREELGPKAPPAFRKAQIRARQKLEEARPRLPTLRLTVDGARDDASIGVKLDGQSVPPATLGLDRPMDPGPHDIEVSAVGYKTASAHVVLKEGLSQGVKLVLDPLPASAPPPEVAQSVPSPSQPPSPPPRPRSEPKPSYVPAAIFFGVGVVGIGVGAALGAVTLGKASHLNSVCQPKNDCPAGEQGDIDSANAFALGSTIAFGVGVVGAAFGTYFLLKPPKSDAEPTATSLTVRPWISPGSAGVAGTF